MSRASSIKAFREACALLRTIDRKFEIYCASDNMHLMSGPSHDGPGFSPRQDRIIETEYGVRISGGDW